MIIDDDRLLREALTELVASEPGLEVVASVGDVASAEPHLEAAELVLVDLGLPGGGTLELVTRLRTQGTKRSIVVSMHEHAECVRAAFAAGANGYVFKASAARNLIDAIEQTSAGRTYVDSTVAYSLETLTPEMVTSPEVPELSERERTVLIELAQGLTYKDIGAKLGIGARTVETYRRRIADKLGLRTRADFLRYAVEMKLLRASA